MTNPYRSRDEKARAEPTAGPSSTFLAIMLLVWFVFVGTQPTGGRILWVAFVMLVLPVLLFGAWALLHRNHDEGGGS